MGLRSLPDSDCFQHIHYRASPHFADSPVDPSLRFDKFRLMGETSLHCLWKAPAGPGLDDNLFILRSQDTVLKPGWGLGLLLSAAGL